MDWISDLLTSLVHTTRNYTYYSAIADLQTLQFTVAPAKPFPACCVFIGRSLATVSNSGDSSASRAQVLPSPTLVQKRLPAIFSTEMDRHLFSASLAELISTQHYQISTPCDNYFART
jgi:hypothetical protein